MKTIGVNTLAKYENLYIATSQDASVVYTSGKTIPDVENELEKQKITNAIIGFIPLLNTSLN